MSLCRTVTTLAITFSLAAGSSLVSAASQTTDAQPGIATGKKGLTYHDIFGTNIASILHEQGMKLPVLSTKGSLDNLDRVASGNASIGFTQADALMYWRDKHSAQQNNIEILGALGKECAFVAVPRDGKVSDEDDLGQKGIKIAVGPINSGSAASWNYLTQLEDDYQNASVYHKGGIRALAGLTTGRYDAFMWVTAEGNMDNKYLKAVMKEDSGLTLISLDDYSLNNKLPSGKPVYEFRDAKIAKGIFSDKTIEAPCTDVLVVGNVDADEEVLDAVSEALLTNRNRIMQRDEK
ncbi:MAG: hypothetical protein OIF57_04315 [Marinobacterium sp.]|nr:hypothetical protein [Marinobacterium sp.]